MCAEDIEVSGGAMALSSQDMKEEIDDEPLNKE